MCLITFQKEKCLYDRHVVKHEREYQPKCSPMCLGHSNTRSQEVNCKHCGKTFTKSASQMRKAPQHFCSRSCAASYNNRHKQHGTRRSTLERFVEEQLQEQFPQLPFECNSKTVIGSELDFYFPTLHFAVELNGIYHYKPIHGLSKFEQITDSDKQKVDRCRSLGITLCVVNALGYSRSNSQQKNYYWDIIKPLLNELLRNKAGAVNNQCHSVPRKGLEPL